MVLVSHLLSLFLPLILLHFFLGKSPQAKPLNRGLGTLNLEHIKISMGNKRQVSLVLSAWLQTPRGTPRNERTPSHTTWFHTLLPQWHVFKRLASGKILHFSPSCEHLPTQHTSHLASPAVGHQAPEGSLGQRFTDTPGSKKSTRDSGFFDRDQPRNEAAQLPGQQERSAQREEKQDHRESNQNGYKKPAPSCKSTSPAPVGEDHGGGSPELSESASLTVHLTMAHPTFHPSLRLKLQNTFSQAFFHIFSHLNATNHTLFLILKTGCFPREKGKLLNGNNRDNYVLRYVPSLIFKISGDSLSRNEPVFPH